MTIQQAFGQKILLKIESENLEFPEQQIHLEDYKQLENYLKKKSDSLNKEGFLTHEIELIKNNDSLYTSRIKKKQKVNFALLKFSDTLSLPRKITKNNPIRFRDLETATDNIYEHLQEKGYTFSKISPTEVYISNDTAYINIEVKKSTQRKIDKVIVKGYDKFPTKFIKNHLYLEKGTVFNEQTIQNTQKQLKKLPFISQTRPPEVLFKKDSTLLYIYMSKKSQNRFDGLVGFSNRESGKIVFNGHLDIKLTNSFHKGETLQFYWSNNGQEQERLKVYLDSPYILNSRFTPSFEFEIYKQDSSFTTQKSNLNLQYTLNNSNSIGVNLKSDSSTNTLISNTSNIDNYSKTLYGISYQYYPVNSRERKFRFATALNLGNKKTNTATTQQQYITALLSWTEKITRRSSFYFRSKSEILNGENLLTNETYQIGGANSIRGFYEESIFTPAYNFNNLEYRLQTARESYLYTFADFGLVKELESNQNNRLYSFGLGYSYKTKGGFINLNYAFGKTNDTPFDFNNGIFHIKFSNSF